MATASSSSIIGDFRGTVGPVVVTGWLGIDVIKLKPARGKDRKPQTPEQAEQSELFGKVNHLLKPLRSLLCQSFIVPKQVSMTPFNAAVSDLMTLSVFTHEGKRMIDLNVIKLSRPKELTQQLWNPVAIAEPGRMMSVTWELNPFPQKCTRLDDRVYLAYCGSASSQFSMVHQKVEREAQQHSFKLTGSTKGEVIYLYAVVISADGRRIAESDYLGAIPIMA